MLWTTPEYYDYNWTVRGDLDPKIVEKLRAAFLALDPANPEHKKILDLQRAKRFIPTAPENYRAIEQAARSAGLPEGLMGLAAPTRARACLVGALRRPLTNPAPRRGDDPGGGGGHHEVRRS